MRREAASQHQKNPLTGEAPYKSKPFLAHRRARFLRAAMTGEVRRAADLKTLFLLLNVGAPFQSFIELPRLPLFARGFQYLRADRITPAVTFPKSHDAVSERGSLGSKGEFTAHFLLEHGDDDIQGLDFRKNDREVSVRVLSQVNAWLQEFSPGVRVDVQNVPMTDFARLEFSYRTRGAGHGQAYRPTNVGFGLTHALPVVVGCLITPPGTMLLIENPEAQLHPQGQVALGKFLARVAASGVQVVVETHSDHILNGIRVAVKREILPPGDLKVHFFSRSSTGSAFRVSPTIDKNGLLSDWPQGFFTQWDDTLIDLLS